MAGELVERLRDQNYAGPMQHLRSWSEIDELFNAAAQRIEDVEADYLRRHNDACDRFEQVIELEARIEALERENATLRAERAGIVEKAAWISETAGFFADEPAAQTLGAQIAAAIRNMGGEG